ncbi:MAG TPA: alkaline phosphatase PafA [Cyclobacteriaceae bacterium]
MRPGLILVLLISSFSGLTQINPTPKPKLIVGIVVDQMRYEYLVRFYDKFSEGGFKKLMNYGFNASNTHYNYIPTYTGPGHASIYTGATPSIHGIIANNWYDRKSKSDVYCAQDNSVSAIGGSDENGKISPRNLLSTTITDELKSFFQLKSKVIGISIKDRGAVLPAGNIADAAYWYDNVTGNFMSSTYYMDALPDWVNNFNEKKIADKYLNKTWEPELPLDNYTESGPDDNAYEVVFSGKESPVFPYQLNDLRRDNGEFKLLPVTPYGNTIVADFTKEAIANEGLGQDEIPDFLAVSFSSTDYIGHAFGPESKEIEDTYVKLDKEIAALLQYLDDNVGTKRYLIFLTADHGVADVPGFLMDNNLPGGSFQAKQAGNFLNQQIEKTYGSGKWIESASNDQLFLNYDLISENGLDLFTVQRKVSQLSMGLEQVSFSISALDMQINNYSHGYKKQLQLGYHPKRSGDVLNILHPGYISSSRRAGTTHGSGYNYDSHVPLIFYGWKIPKGRSVRRIEITDIAPTLSMLLNIRLPDGAHGNPIIELFD